MWYAEAVRQLTKDLRDPQAEREKAMPKIVGTRERVHQPSNL
jgi:hypothetical protein